MPRSRKPSKLDYARHVLRRDIRKAVIGILVFGGGFAALILYAA